MSEATTTRPTGPLSDLSGFQRDLLRCIAAEADQHGLGIKARIEDAYGEEVLHSRLYPNLDDLVERGLVEKGIADRRTNTYNLTERGAQALAADVSWRTEIEL